MSRRKCFTCGRLEDSAYGGWCECGACNWVAAEQPRLVAQVRAALIPYGANGSSQMSTSTAMVVPSPRAITRHEPREPDGPQLDEFGLMRGTNVSEAPVEDYGEGSAMNELLGGVMRGALILIAGAAGNGKSTASAGLAAHAAAFWARAELHERAAPPMIAWLDADQGEPSLVKRCFITAQVENAFDRRVRLLPTGRIWTFDEALALIPTRARVLVIDSLERWGGSSPKQQMAVMTAVRAHGAMLKIVIAGTNKEGGVYGISEIERADDATVFATRSTTSTPSTSRRGGGRRARRPSCGVASGSATRKRKSALPSARYPQRPRRRRRRSPRRPAPPSPTTRRPSGGRRSGGR